MGYKSGWFRRRKRSPLDYVVSDVNVEIADTVFTVSAVSDMLCDLKTLVVGLVHINQLLYSDRSAET